MPRERKLGTRREFNLLDYMPAAATAGEFVPGAAVADAFGYFPDGEGNFRNSIWDNVAEGEYTDAAFQGGGLFADALNLVPGIGAALSIGGKATLQLGKQVKNRAKQMPNTSKVLDNGGDLITALEKDNALMMAKGRQKIERAKKKGAKAPDLQKAAKLNQEAVDMRRQIADAALKMPGAKVTKPENALFDRDYYDIPATQRGGVPGVEQRDIERYKPRETNPLIKSLMADGYNEDLIKRMVQRGLDTGSASFYRSYEPMRRAMLERGYTDEDFVRAVAAGGFGSARNTVSAENAVGGLMQRMAREGIPLDEVGGAQARKLYSGEMGQGVTMMKGHIQPFAEFLKEGVPDGVKDKQKIASFIQNKLGNFRPYTLDTHEAKGLLFGNEYAPFFADKGGFADTVYGDMEAYTKGIAEKMGLDPAVMQENRWFGGGDLTGLKTGGGDFLDNFEKQAAYTSSKRGLPMDRESLRNYAVEAFVGKQPLLIDYSKEGMPDLRPRFKTSLLD